MLVALLAACTFDAQFAADYRCGVGGTCPDGSQCVDGRCASEEPSTVDAGVEIGSDAGDPSQLADDFDDGVLDGWYPWTHPGCTVVETGGAMQLDYSGSGESYCGADTADVFDLRDGAMSVEVVEAPTVARFETYVILYSGDEDQQIQMIRHEGGLSMQLRVNGVVQADATIADPPERFWRIRQEGATTSWDTSADGATWNLRHSTSVAVDASAMFIELAAGHYSPGPGSPVRVRFDHVSVD